ncbi:MAG TPA: succinate dehydrogenase assembly factor 2 [Azospirillum sp.]
MTENASDSLADALAVRRKQLKFRAWHRGTRELDFLIGRFADTHVDSLDAQQMDRFQAVLDLPDVDVYNWIIGALPVPAEHDHDVMRLLMDFRADDRARA